MHVTIDKCMIFISGFCLFCYQKSGIDISKMNCKWHKMNYIDEIFNSIVSHWNCSDIVCDGWSFGSV